MVKLAQYPLLHALVLQLEYDSVGQLLKALLLIQSEASLAEIENWLQTS